MDFNYTPPSSAGPAFGSPQPPPAAPAKTPDVAGFIQAARAKGTSDTDIYAYLKQKGLVAAPKQEAAPQSEGFVKGLVEGPVTMAARPFQALSDAGDYLGTRMEEHNATTPGQKSAILHAEQERATQNQTTSSGPAGLVAPTPANAADVKKDVGRGIQTAAFGMGPVAGGAMFGAGNSLEQGNDLFSGQTAFQTVLGAGAGKVLQLVGEPILNAAGKQIGKITPQFLSDIASQGTEAIQQFAEGHNILPEIASNAVNKTAEAVNTVADKSANAVTEGTKNAVVKGATLSKDAIHPTLSPEEATGQVIQGETEDIAPAQRTLSSMDHSKVKTYVDLQKNIKAQIKPLAEKVDAELLKDPTPIALDKFEQTIGADDLGNEGVKVNYVKQAIKDLKTYYAKTKDVKGLAAIQKVEKQATDKGLNLKEVNDLARTHGSAINAFNANGEAASGLSKQAAENTRSGLKEIARQGLGGPEAQALDAKLSDLYDTQRLVDKQVERVNKANQKTAKQGLVPKVISKTVKGIDVVTGGPLKAIGHAMGTAGSSGDMSVLDIEQSLARNLRNIQKNGGIGARPSMPSSKVAHPATAGFAKVGPGADDLSNVHKEDLYTMKDFTDYVAGDYRPSAAEAHKLELDATRLWEHYFPGRTLPKNLSGISNRFGRVLEKNGL